MPTHEAEVPNSESQKSYKTFAAFLFFFALLSILLFNYIASQNNLLMLRRKLPQIEQEVRVLKEENLRMQFELEAILSPQNLLKMAEEPSMGHLRYPREDEILYIKS